MGGGLSETASVAHSNLPIERNMADQRDCWSAPTSIKRMSGAWKQPSFGMAALRSVRRPLSLRERSAVSPMTGNTDSARIVWLDPSRHCSPQWIAFHLDKPRVDKH